MCVFVCLLQAQLLSVCHVTTLKLLTQQPVCDRDGCDGLFASQSQRRMAAEDMYCC